ncbi:hypothetical protein NE562_10970 [Butyricicoccus faecihominis]|uniref:hypothetical protein n=1 Tax=Butyricicoccus faecihominis TaxID=1712515 RepID=UPI002479B6FA|nr:hypothetical protein [Butyricicoccus faecihominis]MCQ5130184.1 hypothetical protein [Butyricicoccus faecihominis]
MVLPPKMISAPAGHLFCGPPVCGQLDIKIKSNIPCQRRFSHHAFHISAGCIKKVCFAVVFDILNCANQIETAESGLVDMMTGLAEQIKAQPYLHLYDGNRCKYGCAFQNRRKDEITLFFMISTIAY